MQTHLLKYKDMTPKEKAEDLIIKLSNPFAKSSALIAVDELIKEGFFTDGYYNRAAYWQEVKQELEKL